MTNYEKYQLQWMIDHGFSLQDLMTELTLLQYENTDVLDPISAPVDQLFKEWEQDIGFNSEIWASEAEWEDSEEAEPAE